jgi:hypothetical protein
MGLGALTTERFRRWFEVWFQEWVEHRMDVRIDARIDAWVEANLEERLNRWSAGHLQGLLDGHLNAAVDAFIEDKFDIRFFTWADTWADQNLKTRLDAHFDSRIRERLDVHVRARVANHIDDRIDRRIEQWLQAVEARPVEASTIPSPPEPPSGPAEVQAADTLVTAAELARYLRGMHIGPTQVRRILRGKEVGLGRPYTYRLGDAASWILLRKARTRQGGDGHRRTRRGRKSA